MAQELHDMFELLEKISKATPFMFTLVLLFLSASANFFLAKRLYKVWSLFGDSKAVIVGLLVEKGISVRKARDIVKKIIEDN